MTNDVRAILRMVEAGELTAGEARDRLRRMGTATDPAPSASSDPVVPARGIAIIGMAGRYAAGHTLDGIWRTLVTGTSAVREVPPTRWDAARYYHPDPQQPGRTNSRWGGLLDDIDAFDPLFFRLSGAEAEAMDPQQRLFLEVSWSALEDAGYAGDGGSGLSCGVYVGAPASDYPDDAQRSGIDADAQVMMGNDTAILAARISYLLNLRGPSLALNTACSSSLVAVQLAAQAIAAGQIEMAVAGGVCLFVTPGFYISASKAGMLSPTGQCYAFDRRADGFVPGEGAGVVVLKDLAAAMRDGDHIRGVLLGVGTNQDGRSNGITAPNSYAQSDLQQSVYRQAEINPDTIGLIEAHGTGTALGDPIEVEALTRSFADHTDRRQFCAIGSIKTNIGHTGQAAGVAGLIKCLLAFEHETIPPSLNFDEANPHIDFAQTPFYVATSAIPWPAEPGRVRRAAVSSYGYSGTNAHLVVEEPPPPSPARPNPGPQLVPVSAKTREALQQLVHDLAEDLTRGAARPHLADIAYTMWVGRTHHRYRAGFVANDLDELITALRAFTGGSPELAQPLSRSDRARLNERLRQSAGSDRAALLADLAVAYERGFTPDPTTLFPGGGRRTPLPTYPFARDRYWSHRRTPLEPATGIPLERRDDDGAARVLWFRPTGGESYLTDHVVAGRPVLAAMVSAELVRSAVAALGRTATALTGVTWHRPLTMDAPGGLRIALEPDGEELRFTVAAAAADPARPAVTGLVGTATPAAPTSVDVAEIHRRQDRTVAPAECYARLAELGLNHGHHFQVLRELRTNGREVLAQLEAGTADDPIELPWRPNLLDGALQAMTALDLDESGSSRLPYTLDAFEVHAALPQSCLAHVVARADDKVDVTLLDPAGTVLATLRGLLTAVSSRESTPQVRYLRPVWRPVVPTEPESDHHTVAVVGESGDPAVAALIAARPDLQVVVAELTTDHHTLRSDLGGGNRPSRVVVVWPQPPPADLADPDPNLSRLRALCRALVQDRGAGPTEIRVVYPVRGEQPSPFASALGAFARTVVAEDPDLRIRAVGLPTEDGDEISLAQHWPLLWAPTPQSAVDQRVGSDGRLRVRAWEEVPDLGSAPVPSSAGTYLITGGAGGIGLRLARHLARPGVNLILVGRSEHPRALSEQLDALRAASASVTYLRADVTDEAALAGVVAESRDRFGPLTGIVHAAGVLRDRYLTDTTDADAAAVIDPKVTGALLLDQLTQQDPLDFFVVVSSAVAAFGNPGQAIYAYANGVLDSFARQRARQQAAGERAGVTVSLALPAWAGVGMAAMLGDVHRRWAGLDDTEGLSAFDTALGAGEPHLVVVKATADEIAAVVEPEPAAEGPPPVSGPEAPRPGQDTDPDLRPAAEQFLRRRFADELRLPLDRIDPAEPFESYGIDSVLVTKLSQTLEQDLGPIPKTIFFEYRNLQELAGFIVERYPAALARLTSSASDDHRGAVPSDPARPAGQAGSRSQPPAHVATANGQLGELAASDAVAVIGVAGRYPMADDLDTFWDNLVNGRDCITEIPPDRWELDGFYEPERQPHRSYAKWGGFLRDIDRFDPVFFNIAPRDADMIDPQERLFLQTVWHLLEDAGYPRSVLAGTATGVFVGVMYGHYELLPAASDGRLPVSSYASIANRVSYFFDLHGPSLAVDTMCSSSLTAVHLACESLRRGECRTAVAGGVNLTPHPRKYLQLSLGRFASTDGRCRSFGAGGDGYVPGEGVGALLLKPLAKALEDGDHIHAVIRGTAVNHGGRANGYSVPDVRAQQSVVRAALRAAGVSVDAVGYIEAHGTGTALGDPIEIAALSQAYAELADSSRPIPIGSVKSAIGHLESAAGVAALTKVILQMRHGTIAPSLHAEELNPDAALDSSPFVVATRSRAWQAGPTGRRVAGISSFGAGGSNAHVIIEEPPPPSVPDHPSGAEILVLSAPSEPLLRQLAGSLAAHLRRYSAPAESEVTVDVTERVRTLLGLQPGDIGPDDSLAEAGLDEVVRNQLVEQLHEVYGTPGERLPADLDTVADITRYLGVGSRSAAPAPALGDVAYTLQVGREPFAVRFACVVEDLASAAAELAAFADGGSGPRSWHGVTTPDSTGIPVDPAEVAAALAQRDGPQLAQLWTRGGPVDWVAWHGSARRRRVPLVGSHFRRDRHWLVDASDNPDRGAPAVEGSPTVGSGPTEPKREPVMAIDSGARTQLRRLLTDLAADAIGLEPDRLDVHTSLSDYGFDSMALKDLADRIAERLGLPFNPAVFFERPGVAGVTDWLIDEYGTRLAPALAGPVAPQPAVVRAPSAVTSSGPSQAGAHVSGPDAEPIAIIGMSGRFPSAPDLDTFWEHLRERRDLVTEIPSDRWDWRALADESLPPEQRCPFRWGAFIDDVDKFDPRFFGIAPAEAEMMDPQQRILLQVVWSALEDSGYRPSALSGDPVGLFAGVQFSDYQHLLHEAGLLNAQAALGNEHSIAVNRISYLLNLRGPSEPVNTACSSSLVAIHRAVRSLRAGESSLAIAGGIALNLSSHSTVAAGMMGLLSPEGRCKTLDRRADGYVKGEGVAMLVLKPLSVAIADGDHIHGVIRGTAVNHGGRAASLTAPNSEAQAALLRTAIGEADVDPRSIGLLELHGTGTELGDPVEISGIKSAFRRLTEDQGVSWPDGMACRIGSVKTNIGHLEPASGIAGLVKILLAMRHRTIPGMVHLEEVNPYIDLTDTPFQIARETMAWQQPVIDGRVAPRRAGVSSFGFGGVNAHVVIEEYRAERTPVDHRGDLVFPLSARTAEALTELMQAMVTRLRAWEGDPSDRPAAADVAHTLQTGREPLAERIAVVADDLVSFRERLEQALAGEYAHSFRSGAQAPTSTATAAASLASRWAGGEDVDWTVLAASDVPIRRVPLPTYPFARQRYWFTPPDTPPAGVQVAARTSADPAAGTPVTGLAAVAAAEAGGNPIQDRLRHILTGKLKLEPGELDEDRPLQEFGVDSMLSAMIMQVVQEELDIQVSLTALVEYPTLRSLSRYIETEFFVDRPLPAGPGAPAGVQPSGGERNRLPAELLPINTSGSRQPSFWVHGAAGYSTWFQNLSQALGPEYPLYAFQAKGTDGHSMPQSLDEMVEHYVACLRMVQPTGPYVIGGYSFGGLIAMEMARKLQAEGETIRHLVLFDTYPATQEVFDRHHGVYDPDFLQMYLVNYFLKLDEDPSRAIRVEDVEHLPPSLRVTELARLAKDRGQKRIAVEDIYQYLQGGLTCSAHAEGIYQIYQMRPYDASDVLFFQATDGFTGRASALYWKATRILDGYDYITPWREVVDCDFQLVELDNDHLNMLEPPTLATAARHIEAVLKEPPSFDPERYARFQQSFDAVSEFGRDLLANAFIGAGVLPDAGEPTSRDQLRAALEVGPEYHRLFDASVDILVRKGLLEERDDHLAVTAAMEQVRFTDQTVIADRADQLASEHPDAADYLPLLTACQAEVLDVMSGRRAATDVLFPGGSMDLVSELYKGNVQTEFYNRLAADQVAEHVRNFLRRFPRSTAQVFEVGAGTGGTSAFVLDALTENAGQIRYRYTDIGTAFLQMARAQFGDRPYVEFDTYDIERSPEEQGFEPESMDVVLASNVLHTTRRIADTIANCRRLVKPGGVIIINELTHRLDYNTLTFGLTTGWWLYEEEDPRIPGSPLLSAEQWRRSLGEAGFADVEVLGIPGAAEPEQAQCLIVATAVPTAARQ